ncbi:medium-chain acyl-CoA ligase ACSF2, mitochondrial-like [Schistocerca piceifrons]|uniref:medium-chain acyl-CoA ligase ACSF2, mitochondrial-like n=1 Tax=Schistocerca piceifrons TaxID=274613 RepID=UPI001F5EE623|nr:medium-chain acyl-CoA ligase ACSF2, mitochondrial-like [Schistocerca piceifrons]
MRVILRHSFGTAVLLCIRRCSQQAWRPSYWHQPGAQPLLALTMGRLVEQAAHRYGDREAVVSHQQGARLSFRQVHQEVDRLAAGLMSVGLSRGDRLGLWGGNCLEWYVMALAAARAGLALVCLNPGYEAAELGHCLSKVEVRGLVATASGYDRLQKLLPELGSSKPGKLRNKEIPSLTTIILTGTEPAAGTYGYNQVMDLATNENLERVLNLQKDIQPDECCQIQFTSGTTGKPKAAVLTHHNIVNNSFCVGKRLQFNEKQHRICLQVPLFHCYGFCNGLLAALHYGSTLVLPSVSYSARASLEAIEKERCTAVYGTPTMYVDLVSLIESGDVSRYSSLQFALNSGALITEQLFRQVQEKLSLNKVCSVYGLTETSPVVFQSLQSESRDHMLTTVGHVSEHVEVKVIDKEGKMVPIGEPGELCIRGYVTISGYWADEAKTRELIDENGWLKTGDLFILKEDGYGMVVGRLKDMIIRGGENISPKEVQELLETHPDILEAQVFGIPHARLGEQVCSCIRIKEGSGLTPEKVQEFAKGKIAGFKIPKIIEIVAEFPRTTSGKIQTFKLRDAFMKKYPAQ